MENQTSSRRTLSVLVDNEPGVLARVTGLISGRGFNIESLSVAETMDPQVSLITLITSGSPQIIEQIIKQLRKLINVIKVVDLSEDDYVEKQLVLVKVRAMGADRSELRGLCEIFKGKILDVSPKSYTMEFTGNEKKIRDIMALLGEFGIEEQVSTGLTAMTRTRLFKKDRRNGA
ncbi:MAG: acetolactate synthase small subunit [Candidatus Adiutrix sp.]|jgi:acetolactate synthase-1/3 small subunit|nr:acetolactate synthase small subunit [Candidatus Adiutrix sp.]